MTVSFAREELDQLGVTTDLTTAGRAFGMGKSTAYERARAGTFPCRVIRHGGRWVVTTADLRQALLGEGAPAADQVVERLDTLINLIESLLKLQRAQAILAAGNAK